MTITQHLSNAVPKVQHFVSTVRDELSERRAERAAARELQRDLATYTTPREIDDLLATLERYEADRVEPMRSILVHNLMAHQGARLAA
jgi:siroheme synthase (precorrin-2 oxidase/ferrochelatase)